MPKPSISIVIPVYKIEEKYLRHCIESCINQTFCDLEIVLVDDGSPDKCGGICDEYASKDNRIKVIHKQNGGLAAARASGLKALSGEAMMFLDGDDFLDLDCCERVFSLMKEENVQMVMFDQKLVYGSSVKPTPVCGLPPEIFRSNQDCRELQARVLDFNGWMATATSKLVRVDYLHKIGFTTDYGLQQGVEGLVSNINLFEELESVYYIHEPFYNYVYVGDSITHVPNLENNILSIEGMEFINRYAESHPVIPQFKKNLLNRVLYVVITAAIQGCFNPLSSLSYKEKVEWYSSFLKREIIQVALRDADRKGINFQRKLMLFFIEHKLYRGLELFGFLRRYQLNHR